MSNSSLVSYTKLSPYKSSRNGKTIDTITIHCVVGQCGVEALGSVFQTKRASANYGIGYDGRVGLYVNESERSWCTSSRVNDERAVTIECASDAKHPYAVNAKVYAALIGLVIDICKRNNIKKLVWSTNKNERMNHLNGCNMTVHRDYENKACPGKYLYDRHGAIAAAVNAALSGTSTKTTSAAVSQTSNEVTKVTITLNVLKKGSSGAQVRTLQRLLRQLGYVNTDGKTLIKVDGDFGANTLAALKRYQKNAGLTVDGACGQKTWKSLLG